MQKLEFLYKMQIEFSMPVIKHCYSLRCVPFDNEFQKLTSLNIEIDPSNIMTKTEDGFGNTVLTDRIIEQHSLFSVKVSGKAEIDLTKRLPEELNSIYKYPSKHTVAGDNVLKFIETLPDDIITTPVETAVKLMTEIHKVFSYKAMVTNINTTADEALALGSGVCQDYSHILIAVLRYFRIPARYIAGIQKGSGETHAWVEVYEDDKWYGVDVTNNRLIDETYLILSHGRDFADCGINRGLFIGGGTQKQTVFAQIKLI